VNVCSYVRNVRKKVSSSQPVAGIAAILLPEKTAFMNCRQIDQPVQENTSPQAGGVTVIGFCKPVNRSIFFFSRHIPRGFSRQRSGNPGERYCFCRICGLARGRFLSAFCRQSAGKPGVYACRKTGRKKENSRYEIGLNRSGLFLI
jgi:hypothetical protein